MTDSNSIWQVLEYPYMLIPAIFSSGSTYFLYSAWMLYTSHCYNSLHIGVLYPPPPCLFCPSLCLKLTPPIMGGWIIPIPINLSDKSLLTLLNLSKYISLQRYFRFPNLSSQVLNFQRHISGFFFVCGGVWFCFVFVSLGYWHLVGIRLES